MKIKKGDMMTFSEGEYSDYVVNGLVVAITNFDLKELQAEWESEHTKIDKEKFIPDREVVGTKFLPWLVRKGLVEDVDYIEIHTGSDFESYITFRLQDL